MSSFPCNVSQQMNSANTIWASTLCHIPAGLGQNTEMKEQSWSLMSVPWSLEPTRESPSGVGASATSQSRGAEFIQPSYIGSE